MAFKLLSVDAMNINLIVMVKRFQDFINPHQGPVI